MTVFISGGAKCGKSSIAQELAVKLSRGEGLYYVATMIPSGSEDGHRLPSTENLSPSRISSR